MNTRNQQPILAIVFVTFVLTQPGMSQDRQVIIPDPINANWVMTSMTFSAGFDSAVDFRLSFLGDVLVADSDVHVRALPESLDGNGRAFERVLGENSRLIVSAVGLRFEAWSFVGVTCDCGSGGSSSGGSSSGGSTGSGQGRATVESSYVEIEGLAELISNECAAAALGFTRFDSSVLNRSVIAQAVNSAGETVTNLLGTAVLAPGGLGLQLPAGVPVGHGAYKHPDKDALADQKITNFFSFTSKTTGFLHVYANGTRFTDGDSKAKIQGKVQYKIVLDASP